MKLLVVVSLLALGAAASEGQTREKRGLLGAPIPVSYSAHYVHHTPSVAVAYHAPLLRPLPLAKLVAPSVSYYPALLPHYSYAHSYTHSYAHPFTHFH